jgi:hypothetical protein
MGLAERGEIRPRAKRLRFDASAHALSGLSSDDIATSTLAMPEHYPPMQTK